MSLTLKLDTPQARIFPAVRRFSNAVTMTERSAPSNVIAIPESGLAAHVKENAVALTLMLTSQELQTLDAAYPPPH